MKKASIVFSVCLALLVIIIGCAKPTASPSTPAPKQTPTSAPAPTTAATPTLAPKPAIQPMKLVMASALPPTDVASLRTKWFMDEVTKRTGGAITFTSYWAASLASTAGHLDLVQKGVVEIVDTSAMYNPGVIHTAGFAYSFPMLDTDPSQVYKAYKEIRKGFPEVEQMFKSLKVKVLASSPFGPAGLLSKVPVNTLDDMKGKKVGAAGKYYGAWMQPAGMTPVGMPLGDRYMGFQTGLIDMSALGLEGHVSSKSYEVAKYYIDAGLGSFETEGLLIALDKFNSYSPELQKILVEVGEASEDWIVKYHATLKSENIALMQKAGVTIGKLSEADRAKWLSLVPDTPADMAAYLESKGMPGYKMVQRYQEVLKQNGVKFPREFGVKK